MKLAGLSTGGGYRNSPYNEQPRAARLAAFIFHADRDQFERQCKGRGGCRKIRYRIAIQLLQESFSCHDKQSVQTTLLFDHTCAMTIAALATDQCKVFLCRSHNRAYADFLHVCSQPQAAATPAYGVYPALSSEFLYHFRQVVSGNTICVGYFVDGCAAVIVKSKVNQDPQRVVSKICQSHLDVLRRKEGIQETLSFNI